MDDLETNNSANHTIDDESVGNERQSAYDRIRNRLREGNSNRTSLDEGFDSGTSQSVESRTTDSGDDSGRNNIRHVDNSSGANDGTSTRKRGRPSNAERARRAAEAAQSVESSASLGEEEVNVAGPSDKPKRTYTSRKKKGAFQPENINQVVTAGFGAIAMVSQRPHWAIQNEDAELNTWTPAAAELLNRIPEKYAQKAIDASAIATVVVGVSGLVFVRVMQDNYLAMAKRQQASSAQFEAQERQQAEAGVSNPTKPDPRYPVIKEVPRQSNGKESGLFGTQRPEVKFGD